MIDRSRLQRLRADEEERFVALHPGSAELAEQARGSLLAGVPMPWMTPWPPWRVSPSPLGGTSSVKTHPKVTD